MLFRSWIVPTRARGESVSARTVSERAINAEPASTGGRTPTRESIREEIARGPNWGERTAETSAPRRRMGAREKSTGIGISRRARSGCRRDSGSSRQERGNRKGRHKSIEWNWELIHDLASRTCACRNPYGRRTTWLQGMSEFHAALDWGASGFESDASRRDRETTRSKKAASMAGS